MKRVPGFLAAALLCLAAAACQPAGEAAKSARLQQTAPSVDAADYACSYFYFLWGRNAELRQDFDEALEAYEKAVICDPQATYAQSKIPILLVRLDRAEEAARWLERHLAKSPEDVNMRLLHAHILLGSGRVAEALAEYDRILQGHPDDPSVTMQLAEMYLLTGHAAEARRILTRALRRDPQSYQAQLLMARLLRGEGRDEEALERYARALELNWSAEVQAEEAELLTLRRDYDRAEALYREIIDREEQNEAAYLGLVRLFVRQNKEDEALAELLNLRRAADKPLWVDMAAARLYIKRGQDDEARAILEQTLKREGAAEARLLLAALLHRQGKFEAALRQVRLIDNQAPEYPEALGLMADLYRALNREDDAVLFFERNIAGALSRHPAMYPLLAALHDEQGRAAMARRVLEQGLDQYPEDEDLLYVYGSFLEIKKEHELAMAVMERLVALNPNNAAALNFVGYTWADQGVNLPRALDYILHAARLRPESAAIRDSLGWVFYRLGRLEEAAAELEKAHQADNDPEITEHLAEVYEKSGKAEAALTLYRDLLEQLGDPEDSATEAARRALEERIRRLESPEAAPSPEPNPEAS